MRAPEYEPTSTSSILRWPGGRTVAVWVVLNVEHYLTGRPGPSLQPHLSRGLDVANHGWREYGNRAGFRRLHDLLTGLGLPVTAALNGELCGRHPEIVRAVADAGWAVLAHGLDNSTRHDELTPAIERDRIAATLTMLENATGRRPTGWLTPAFAISTETHRLLGEAGLVYTADRCDDDVPYWLDLPGDDRPGDDRPGDDRPGGRLLSVPYSLETNDISLLLGLHYTPAQFCDAVVAHIARLCAEGRPGVAVGVGLHTFLVGQPGRLESLRDCLRQLAAMPDVWMCTGDEISTRVIREEVRSDDSSHS
jgi:allantoinase